MKRELVCVICPNGCSLEVVLQETKEGLEILDVTGALCKKGDKWVRQELISPERTIASSILVDGGEFPLVSVRTDSPIPLDSIMSVMEEIRKARVKAPVKIGQVIISRPAGTACNIIATRNVPDL